ncbi:MAG: hypothetical protein EPO10_19710 [Reyranella sp.]|uniref:hypothetical protein n=1 Tax=Reyranella sp. TaxID=1929291 RepID=UPI0011FDBA5B|nr:hypothetical protein [Reyranella sp.]TAJ97362.1 MAG: hypothetical protein EPO41_02855 [Reyranella sp.]TBR27119.1 MAG: hypothetical protein EPO10_19710 [Reyranella sp.]
METARTLLDDFTKYLVGPTDPRERLDILERDRLGAEAEIRAVLDKLAAKYAVTGDDVDDAMVSIGLAIGDMTYEREIEYLEEIDVTPPV